MDPDNQRPWQHGQCRLEQSIKALPYYVDALPGLWLAQDVWAI